PRGLAPSPAWVGRVACADTWRYAVCPRSGGIHPDEPFRPRQHRLSPATAVSVGLPGDTGTSSLALDFSTTYEAEKTPVKASLHGGSSFSNQQISFRNFEGTSPLSVKHRDGNPAPEHHVPWQCSLVYENGRELGQVTLRQ